MGFVQDVMISRQCALLLSRGRWWELVDLTAWAIDHRRLPDGKPHPSDLYYRAYALRYLLAPEQARQDAEAAIDGLASALDPERLAGALLESGASAIYQGRFEDALKCAFDLRYRRGRYAIPRWQSWGGWLAAVALCHQGKPHDAAGALGAAMERFEDEQYEQAIADLAIVKLLAERVSLALRGPPPRLPQDPCGGSRSALQHEDLDLVLADLALAHGDRGEARSRYERVNGEPSCPAAAAWAALGLAEVDRLEHGPRTH